MGKLWKRMVICACIAGCLSLGSIIADRQRLSNGLVRLHVVAASDSPEDQQIKLQVRDALIQYLHCAMENITDPEAAKAYLRENLPKLQKVTDDTLDALGVDCNAVVRFCREEFSKRVYDSFTLPAGVYDSLRVIIGDGEGKNWWCVVFPTLCFTAAADEVQAVAAGAGFSPALTGAITGEEGYEVRFFLLEALGRLENIFSRQELPPVFWTDSVVSLGKDQRKGDFYAASSAGPGLDGQPGYRFATDCRRCEKPPGRQNSDGSGTDQP